MPTQTPLQYAKTEIAAGRHPNMPIDSIAGAFYLCNSDWTLLPGPSYSTRDAAIAARSKILARALAAASKAE